MNEVHTPYLLAASCEMVEGDDDMVTSAKPVVEVPQDAVGAILRVTCVTRSGAVQPVDGGSDVLFHCSTPEGVAVTTDGVGAYATDGSDGDLDFVLTANEVSEPRDLWCEFEVQGLPTGTRITRVFILRVTRRARVEA